jgi:hypothetical protein
LKVHSLNVRERREYQPASFVEKLLSPYRREYFDMGFPMIVAIAQGLF